MKALVLATLLGGAGGLWLGARPVDHRAGWLAEARRGLTGDVQTADLDRALAAVARVLELGDDVEARFLREDLLHQKQCREDFDLGEHLLANNEPDRAYGMFRVVVSEDCKLGDFARTRLEQIRP